MTDITGIGSVSDLAKDLLDRFCPNKTEEEKQNLLNAITEIKGQLEVNSKEAESTNLFISGWRPFIGWVCGISCAYNWVGISLIITIGKILGSNIEIHPADITEMLPILVSMLGLGGYRTFEKINGVASK